MSFPNHIEDVAQLRAFDEDTALSNESLLSILRDTEMYDEREMLAILKAYRARHGFPVAKAKELTLGDDPATVADWLCGRQIDTLGLVLKEIDPVFARRILAITMKMFAQHVATTSRNELVSASFDEVLLDLLIDARGA